MSTPTKIGIIGSGNMGRALGVRFAQCGHQVFFGARDLATASNAAAQAKNGSQSGSLDDAARFGSILLWTMREPDPLKILSDVSLLKGKTLIDLNNRDYATEAKSGAWFERAIAERLQENAPESHVVKAFNTMAMETFDTSANALHTAGAQTFLAGNNDTAKAQVSQLTYDLGFEAVDLGSGPAAFRAAEALGDVIRLLMIDKRLGGQAHIKLVTLPPPDLAGIGKREASNYA